MCGFAGILTTRRSVAEGLEQYVRAMINPIVHRGPDDCGVWTDGAAGIALGFRRLAIIDLSALGHQPMRSASGRYTLVFNGEVFNHHELRRELESVGVRFRGHSDTETILAAFEQWGIERSVRRFVGMFAIAVWDASDRALSLIRDRLGIKPLFVYRKCGQVMFGSELKALIAGPDFDRALDPNAVSAYLRYLYVPGPASIFRNVQKLLPGHILTIRSADAPLPASTAYWSIADAERAASTSPVEGSDEEMVNELERLLEDAVRLRLQADVPVGALLSGGIDSSTVVALAQAASVRPLKTYAIGFDVADHDETAAAAGVARHLGTDHTELMLTGSAALHVVPELPRLFDEPLADPSQIPTYLICQMARREVTVALSGDGGDEILAGYHRYIQGAKLIGQLRRIPRSIRRAVGAGIGGVSSTTWDDAYRVVAPVLPRALRHRLAGQKMVKLGALLAEASDSDMYRSLLSSWQRPDKLLNEGTEAPSAVDRALYRNPNRPLLDRMMATDQATYLPDDLLAKVDRASMAVSLEVRVPLLDHRVVEYAWRLPRSLKIRDGQGKWALRQILYRRVPRSLVDRPKMGFTVPTGAWLQGPLRDWAGDLLFDSQATADGLLNQAVLRRAWRALEAGHMEAAPGLWAVLMLQSWRRHWLS